MSEPSTHLRVGVDFELRFATIRDISFILDSWCSNQADSLFFREVPDDVVKVELRARIRRLMSPLATFVMVYPSAAYCEAHGLPFSEDDLWGYIVYSYDKKTHSPVVHFLYVKHGMRRRRIAKQLLREAAGVKLDTHFWSTAISPIGKRMLAYYGGTFNPFFLEHVNELTNMHREGVG